MMRRKQPVDIEQQALHSVPIAQAHLAHVALLREARVHHKAIALEIRTFYDSVAAEAVPNKFLALLRDDPVDESG
jgi:hypothetical protein